MAAEKTPPRRLGRGLDALLGKMALPPSTTDEQGPYATRSDSALQEISLAAIRVNRYQPRKEFDQDELGELQASIQATGLLQPITLRRLPGGDGYEVVAGERRLRAVRDLGWKTIPAIVREYDDRTMLTLALVENLQREDLNPIEEAEGYARLAGDFGLTQHEIAELVGKDRSTVANLLRILNLPGEVRQMLERGALTMGHARALLGVDDADQLRAFAREIVERDMSVRSIEQRVRQQGGETKAPKNSKGGTVKSDSRPAEVRQVEDSLRSRFQTDIAVELNRGERGEIRIQFYSYDDLNRLLELMGVADWNGG